MPPSMSMQQPHQENIDPFSLPSLDQLLANSQRPRPRPRSKPLPLNHRNSNPNISIAKSSENLNHKFLSLRRSGSPNVFVPVSRPNLTVDTKPAARQLFTPPPSQDGRMTSASFSTVSPPPASHPEIISHSNRTSRDRSIPRTFNATSNSRNGSPAEDASPPASSGRKRARSPPPQQRSQKAYPADVPTPNPKARKQPRTSNSSVSSAQSNAAADVEDGDVEKPAPVTKKRTRKVTHVRSGSVNSIAEASPNPKARKQPRTQVVAPATPVRATKPIPKSKAATAKKAAPVKTVVVRRKSTPIRYPPPVIEPDEGLPAPPGSPSDDPILLVPSVRPSKVYGQRERSFSNIANDSWESENENTFASKARGSPRFDDFQEHVDPFIPESGWEDVPSDDDDDSGNLFSIPAPATPPPNSRARSHSHSPSHNAEGDGLGLGPEYSVPLRPETPSPETRARRRSSGIDGRLCTPKGKGKGKGKALFDLSSDEEDSQEQSLEKDESGDGGYVFDSTGFEVVEEVPAETETPALAQHDDTSDSDVPLATQHKELEVEESSSADNSLESAVVDELSEDSSRELETVEPLEHVTTRDHPRHLGKTLSQIFSESSPSDDVEEPVLEHHQETLPEQREPVIIPIQRVEGQKETQMISAPFASISQHTEESKSNRPVQRQRDDNSETEEENDESGDEGRGMRSDDHDSDDEYIPTEKGGILITSHDTEAAARAATILRLHHDYIQEGVLLPRSRRSSFTGSVSSRRHSKVFVPPRFLEGTPGSSRSRTRSHSTGPGPLSLRRLDEILAETEGQIRRGEIGTPIRGRPGVRGYLTPNSVGTFDASPYVGLTPSSPQFKESRPWTKPDWQNLERAYVHERRALAHSMGFESSVQVGVESVDVSRVVQRFLEENGLGVEDEEGLEWSWDKLIRRATALQSRIKKLDAQRANISFAVPAPPSSVPFPSGGNDSPSLGRSSKQQHSQPVPVAPLPASLHAPRYAHLQEEVLSTTASSSRSSPETAVPSVEPKPRPAPAPQPTTSRIPVATYKPTNSSAPLSKSTSSITNKVLGYFRRSSEALDETPQVTRIARQVAQVRAAKAAGQTYSRATSEMSEVSAYKLDLSHGTILPTPARPQAEPLPDLHHVETPPPPPLRSIPPPKKVYPLNPTPQLPPPPATPDPLRNRKSSGGSIKDLIKGFEELAEVKRVRAQSLGAPIRRIPSGSSIGERPGTSQEQRKDWVPPRWRP